MSAVDNKGYAYDPWKGARLTGSGDTLYGPPQLMLAPAIQTFETLGDGKVQLTGRCQNNAELRFTAGGTYNIGTASNGAWTFSVPAGRYGPMSIYQDNRNCPPRDLLLWNPVVVTIKPQSTSTSMGTCDFAVTYRLTARAVASGDRDGILVWGKPDYAFNAAWDPDGSVVTWSINGNASVTDLFGTSQCSWTGGNSKAFNTVSILPGDTGGLVSYDGKTAYLKIDPPFDLEYTASCSGPSAPTYACGIYSSVNVEVQLGSDWSILPGSTTDFAGNPGRMEGLRADASLQEQPPAAVTSCQIPRPRERQAAVSQHLPRREGARPTRPGPDRRVAPGQGCTRGKAGSGYAAQLDRAAEAMGFAARARHRLRVAAEEAVDDPFAMARIVFAPPRPGRTIWPPGGASRQVRAVVGRRHGGH